MIQKLKPHRYKLGIFLLLLAASLISVMLAWARMLYSGTRDYSSLIWNLGLAWIPFVFASLAYIVSWSRRLLILVLPICALIWLVFFPNAPYILTDFQHLSTNPGNAPVWFDVLMLLWFAWTGLMLGVTSLHFMQEIVNRAFGRASGWLFAIGSAVLSSVGITLGRFYRWNSWDLLNDPLPIAHNLLDLLRHPFANLRAYGFTLLFTLLFLFVYLTFHTFGRIMQENDAGRGA
jgi:uncharacterized membrane protein